MKNVFVAAALLLMTAGGARADLITNGSFENPVMNTDWAVFQSIQGWTRVLGTGIEIQTQSAIGVVPHDGRNYVELDSDSERGGLSGETTNSAMTQILNLAPGTYQLGFWFRPRTNTANDNGISVYLTNTFTAGNGNTFVDDGLVGSVDGISSTQNFWKQYVYQFTVQSAGQHALVFHAGGRANELGGFVDSVSMVRVPEPASMLLVGLGLVGVGSRLRRRA